MPSSPAPFGLPMFAWRLLMAAAILAVLLFNRAHAGEAPCDVSAPQPVVFEQPRDSWVFMRSRYTHDPETCARVAQYDRKAPVEPLDDPRLVTSGYSRTRTIIRGADGSVDSYYRVQNYGNGRGGMDAEWERFHDAWRGSTIAGGDFQAYPGYPGYGYGGYTMPYYGGGYPGYGYGHGQPGMLNRHYGPGTGMPDAGRLDPDGADGYREQLPRTPDRRFFNYAEPNARFPN
jgi:hypothetical protein